MCLGAQDLVPRKERWTLKSTYCVMARSPGKILWRIGIWGSVTSWIVDRRLGSIMYPLPPIGSARPSIQPIFLHTPKRLDSGIHTIHKIRQVHSIASPLRIPIGQYPRIVERPAEYIRYDNHNGFGGDARRWIRHVSLEAVDRLDSTGGGSLVQHARGAIFAGHCGWHCGVGWGIDRGSNSAEYIYIYIYSVL